MTTLGAAVTPAAYFAPSTAELMVVAVWVAIIGGVLYAVFRRSP